VSHVSFLLIANEIIFRRSLGVSCCRNVPANIRGVPSDVVE